MEIEECWGGRGSGNVDLIIQCIDASKESIELLPFH